MLIPKPWGNLVLEVGMYKQNGCGYMLLECLPACSTIYLSSVPSVLSLKISHILSSLSLPKTSFSISLFRVRIYFFLPIVEKCGQKRKVEGSSEEKSWSTLLLNLHLAYTWVTVFLSTACATFQVSLISPLPLLWACEILSMFICWIND